MRLVGGEASGSDRGSGATLVAEAGRAASLTRGRPT